MDNIPFRLTDKIGDIVAHYPFAADVFKSYGIDFCCGGGRPLKDAVKKQELNEADILQALYEARNEAAKEDKQVITDWLNASLGVLINHIVNTHHSFLQSELPILSELTQKILRVHGQHHSELSRVYKLYSSLKAEIEAHLIKEEEQLFPLIKKYEKNPTSSLLDEIGSIIRELENEHEGAGDILKELRKITNDYTAPADGCETYQITYRKLQGLESDLFQHIHLENNILFPRLALKN